MNEGVSLGSLKEEKSTGKEKVHRAGRVRDTNDTSADGQCMCYENLL